MLQHICFLFVSFLLFFYFFLYSSTIQMKEVEIKAQSWAKSLGAPGAVICMPSNNTIVFCYFGNKILGCSFARTCDQHPDLSCQEF